MKIKIGYLFNAKPVFEKLMKYDLPFDTVRVLGKVIKLVNEEMSFVEEKRVELVRKLGVEDEKKNIKVPQEKMEEFIKVYNEILGTEIDFDTFITVKYLQHPNITLSTQDYYLLEKFIVE